MLSYEEIAKIVRLFSELDVSKVHLTGGEPLLRKDILSLDTRCWVILTILPTFRYQPMHTC